MMMTGGNRGTCRWTRPGATLSISNPIYYALRSKRSLRNSNKQEWLEWQFYTLIYLTISFQLQTNKTSHKNARYMSRSPACVWKKSQSILFHNLPEGMENKTKRNLSPHERIPNTEMKTQHSTRRPALKSRPSVTLWSTKNWPNTTSEPTKTRKFPLQIMLSGARNFKCVCSGSMCRARGLTSLG